MLQNVSDSVVSYSFPKEEALVSPKLSKKVIDSRLPSFFFIIIGIHYLTWLTS